MGILKRKRVAKKLKYLFKKMAKLPQSTASKQEESSNNHDDVLKKLLDRLNSIVAQKTPFKKSSLPPGIANQLYNILLNENPDWPLDKKSTRKRLVQLFKERVMVKDRMPPISPTLRKSIRQDEIFTSTPRKLFQNISKEEGRVPLGSLLSPEQKSDSDESVIANPLMKTYTKVLKKLSDKPLKRSTISTRKTRSQSKS